VGLSRPKNLFDVFWIDLYNLSIFRNDNTKVSIPFIFHKPNRREIKTSNNFFFYDIILCSHLGIFFYYFRGTLILNIAGDKVTFIAKDYRDRAIKKPVTMDGVEFLRRFTMYILPGRFVKIRRYGIYNHTAGRNLKLRFIPEQSPDIDALIKRKEPPETNLQRFTRITGIDP
jgi:hypothetical protein